MVQATDPAGSYYDPGSQPQAYCAGTTDTLESIAERFAVTPSSIIAANPALFPPHAQQAGTQLPSIDPGTVLMIPAASDSVRNEPIDETYNPIVPASGTTYTARTDSGGISWNPELGRIAATGSAHTDLATPPLSGKGTSLSSSVKVKGEAGIGINHSNGNTVITVSDSLSVSGSAGLKFKGRHPLLTGSVEAGNERGFRSRFQVILPGEPANAAEIAATINPFDPTTIPVGAKVIISAESFSGEYSKAMLAHIAAQTNLETSSGASFSIERTSTDSINVMMGPHEAISRSNALGIDFHGLEAMFGRNTAHAETTLRSATFDIGNPDAQAAFDHFARTGVVVDGTAGVSNLATIQRLDSLSQSQLTLKYKGIGIDHAGMASTGSAFVISYPDGSRTVLEKLSNQPNVPLTITRRFDASGEEIISERRYRYDLGDLQASQVELLNLSMGRHSFYGNVHAGATTVEFDQAQMEELYANAKVAVDTLEEQTPGGSHELYPAMVEGAAYDERGDDALQFAAMLAIGGRLTGYTEGADQFIEQMREIAQGADGQLVQGTLEWLDATIATV